MSAACIDIAEATDCTFAEWSNLVRAEYREMPGLSLTERQVARLWQLDQKDARDLLSSLVQTGFLRCTENGAYIRID